MDDLSLSCEPEAGDEFEPSPPLRVVLIEPDPEYAERLGTLLELAPGRSFGVQVFPTLTQVAADPAPDAIVLALDDTGFAALEGVGAVADRFPDVPLVVVAPSHEAGFARGCVARGASGYLRKEDMNLGLLSFAVGQVVRRHSLLQELEQSRVRARELSCTDLLTGLANRAVFDDRLHQAISNARRTQRRLAVILLSLDGFREINETLGHATGDKLLEVIARRIREHVRESDTAARLRGDEFALLANNLKEPFNAGKVADQILEATSKTVVLDGMTVVPRVSMGIATFPEDGGDPDVLLSRAAGAMRQAKSQVGNRYEFFDHDLQTAARTKGDMADDLRGAIGRDEFSLLYQPQIDPVHGRVAGAEALIRWQRPGKGPVAPLDFLPLAEETGLIVPIGEWVLRRACQDFSRHAVVKWRPRVAVNVSIHQFGQPDFVTMVQGILEETGLPSEMLELEITESCLMQNIDITCERLLQIQDLGVRVAVDDFGTGFSSLAYLQRLPVDCLKIDKYFVDRIESDPENATIVAAIVAMAKALNLSTVAEGVENVAQMNLLASYGCTRLQGYMFGKPGGLPSLAYAFEQQPFWWGRPS
jgi:diguanylate cyclase (GGDEF)-like protein